MTCPFCGSVGRPVSHALGACVECIRSSPGKVLPPILHLHAQSRREFGLPIAPPQEADGVICPLCQNECRIPPGGLGFCGLRTNREGKLVHLAGIPRRGLLHWYYDPLPTNCVADWVCPGNRQYGRKNLAVFYTACSFNCLFCQNWHFRESSGRLAMSAEELAAQADPRTFCICFFGGDPTPQMPHALATARRLAKKVRICWETNGSMHPQILEEAVELSLSSGGCIKFDLKAFNADLHVALTATANRRTLSNFELAARFIPERREPPLLIASTLLVPGYVDVAEVSHIAHFIARLDPMIPYALLAFCPNFYLPDLPPTSRRHAEECFQAATRAGLTNVRIGNVHLLTNEY